MSDQDHDLREQLVQAQAIIDEAIVALQEGDEAEEVLEDLLAGRQELGLLV
jgi:hypothetical protein